MKRRGLLNFSTHLINSVVRRGEQDTDNHGRLTAVVNVKTINQSTVHLPSLIAAKFCWPIVRHG